MATKLHIKLITPTRTVLEEEADEVVAHTLDGEITILANHTPIVTVLKPGELLIRTDKQEKPLAIAGGIIEMFRNTLIILADTAEHVKEIDLDASEAKAQKLAKQLKQKNTLDINTYNALSERLAKHKVRVEIFKKWSK